MSAQITVLIFRGVVIHMSHTKDHRSRILFGCLGGAMLAGGVAGMVRGFVFHRGDGRFLDGSETLATFGLILLVGSILAKYLVPTMEAYRLGEDIGHEKGFREGRRQAKPVVVELASYRRSNSESDDKPISG